MDTTSSVYEVFANAVNTDLADSNSKAAIRMLERFKKKLNPASSKTDADIEALSKFRSDIERVKSFTIGPNADIYINEAKSFIWSMLCSGTRMIASRYDLETWPQATFLPETLSHPDFIRWGYGSTASDIHTSIAEKVDPVNKALSYTRSVAYFLPFLKPFYSPLYYRVLNAFVEKEGLVVSSRICTVPKNEDTSRIIACEPTVNLWFELAIGKYLELCLESVGLNIHDQQEKNQKLAFEGSKIENEDKNPYCTIDLSSASDSISIDLVRRLFPQEWFSLFMALRTESCTMPDTGEILQLPMVSTMGNGFTFPLLTIVCTALTYAVQRIHGPFRNNFINWNDMAVFGDDIIVRKDMFSPLCDVLESCGFLVNHKKSYSTGYFRESCGGDFFNGKFITPVYIKSLDNPDSILIALNQCLDWSSRHVYLSETCKFLYSLLPRSHRNLVPSSFSFDQGIIYPTSHGTRHVVYLEKNTKTDKYPRRLKDDLLMFIILTGAAIGNGLDDSFNFSTRKSRVVSKVRKIPWPFGWDYIHPPKRCTQFWFKAAPGVYTSNFEDATDVRSRHKQLCFLVEDIITA